MIIAIHTERHTKTGNQETVSCFFAPIFGIFTDYIQQVRIDKAEHLLAYTDLPVGEVAKAVGYTAAGHFAELFRKSKGTLPLEYRKIMMDRKMHQQNYHKKE